MPRVTSVPRTHAEATPAQRLRDELRRAHHPRPVAPARQQPPPLHRHPLLDRTRADRRGRSVRRGLHRRCARRLRRVRRRHRAALREGLQIPNNDPMLVVPAMAAVTEHLGFGITFSTSYEPPFAFARRMSTLDHLTNGRVGWNIVTRTCRTPPGTSASTEIPHDTRYEIADEYLDVALPAVGGLVGGRRGAPRRRAGDLHRPGKVHPIDHVGEHFRVAGPHLSEPSPQRTPALFLATGSPAGIARAGQHAEVVFTGGARRGAHRRRRPGRRRRQRPRPRRRPVRHAGRRHHRADPARGRRQGLAVPCLRERGGPARPRQRPLRRASHPRSRTVRDALERGGRRRRRLVGRAGARRDRRRAARPGERGLDGAFWAAGVPEAVTEQIEGWLDDDGIDGINLRQYHSFDTVRDFGRYVTPLLQERGRLPERYTPGETLRERVTGGPARLPASHPPPHTAGPASPPDGTRGRTGLPTGPVGSLQSGGSHPHRSRWQVGSRVGGAKERPPTRDSTSRARKDSQRADRPPRGTTCDGERPATRGRPAGRPRAAAAPRPSPRGG